MGRPDGSKSLIAWRRFVEHLPLPIFLTAAEENEGSRAVTLTSPGDVHLGAWFVPSKSGSNRLSLLQALHVGNLTVEGIQEGLYCGVFSDAFDQLLLRTLR